MAEDIISTSYLALLNEDGLSSQVEVGSATPFGRQHDCGSLGDISLLNMFTAADLHFLDEFGAAVVQRAIGALITVNLLLFCLC